MARYYKFLFLLSTLSLLLACSEYQDTLEEVKKMREMLDAQSKQWQIAADNMVKAMPGERERRLIDAAHSGDPVQVEMAKKFVKSLYKIDIDASYEVSIEFGFDATQQIRAHFWQYNYDGENAVKYHVENKMFNPTFVSNTLTEYRPRRELIAAAKESVNKKIDEMKLFQYQTQPDSHSENSGGGFSHQLFYVNCQQVHSEKNCGYSRGKHFSLKDSSLATFFRNDLKSILESAIDGIEETFKPVSTVATQSSLKGDWNAIANPLLFVAILEEDWTGLEGDIVVRAYVHKKDEKGNALSQQRPYTFQKEEFQLFKTGHPSVPGGGIMWASHNMNGTPFISAEIQRQLAELEKTMVDYEVYQETKKRQ